MTFRNVKCFCSLCQLLTVLYSVTGFMTLFKHIVPLNCLKDNFSIYYLSFTRLEAMTEENDQIHGQLGETRGKVEALISEKSGLQQQCTNAIRKWNEVFA